MAELLPFDMNPDSKPAPKADEPKPALEPAPAVDPDVDPAPHDGGELPQASEGTEEGG